MAFGNKPESYFKECFCSLEFDGWAMRFLWTKSGGWAHQTCEFKVTGIAWFQEAEQSGAAKRFVGVVSILG